MRPERCTRDRFTKKDITSLNVMLNSFSVALERMLVMQTSLRMQVRAPDTRSQYRNARERRGSTISIHICDVSPPLLPRSASRASSRRQTPTGPSIMPDPCAKTSSTPRARASISATRLPARCGGSHDLCISMVVFVPLHLLLVTTILLTLLKQVRERDAEAQRGQAGR